MVMAAMTLPSNPIIGLIIIGLVVISAYLVYQTYRSLKKREISRIRNVMNDLEGTQSEILLQMSLGIILMHENRKTIEWVNPFMQGYFGDQPLVNQSLENVDKKIYDAYQELLDGKEEVILHCLEHTFNVKLLEDNVTLCFQDITELEEIKEREKKNRIVIGEILIDSYDETVMIYSDRNRSLVDNYMTQQLASWGKKFNIFVKQIDDDRFSFASTYRNLERLEENKFSILDSVREATMKQGFPLTLSMGIAYQVPNSEGGTRDLGEIADFAHKNLDQALSRGGDQVVIRTKTVKARYYGGKTNPMVKRTHVRSRKIASSIAMMMQKKDSIFVMGHDYPDTDALGASIGINRIAALNGKKCWIVLNEKHLNEDIKKMIQTIRREDKSDLKDAFISPEEAEKIIRADSLLIMVDHHRPSISMAPQLIQRVKGVVIIDHHRRSEDIPSQINLEYIEPYASSTCELVTEFFDYQDLEENVTPLNRVEASAMLAGIVVDSRNFSLRTGSRTFDAASYLKSSGADSILIQEWLKEDFDTYMKRNHLIENVRYLEPNIGIAYGEDDVAYNQVIAAQAADMLLSIDGISASYVIFLREDGRVGISARSMGNVNVQTVMEKLGGGGHLSNAATQLPDVSVSEARTRLIDLLEANEEETV